ncbi:MAG: acyl-CoA thioesterase [Hyphomicrobiaceae bacterium]
MPDNIEPDLTDRRIYPFWSREKIRFGDVDRQNHVNNLVVCAYIECSRVELRERCFPKYARDQSIAWLIVHFEVTFKAALHYPGEVDVGCCVLRIGRKSYVLGHAVFDDDTCIATAKTTTVFGDRETSEGRPIPEELRRHFEALRPVATVAMDHDATKNSNC